MWSKGIHLRMCFKVLFILAQISKQKYICNSRRPMNYALFLYSVKYLVVIISNGVEKHVMALKNICYM